MLESLGTVLNAYFRVPLKIYTVRVAEVEPQMAWSFKQTLLYRDSHNSKCWNEVPHKRVFQEELNIDQRCIGWKLEKRLLSLHIWMCIK